jgi:hypothetical protein
MRWRFVVALGAALLACGGGDGKIDTEGECQAAGGRVVPAPGPPAMCAANEEKIGDIPFGIEGAICCRPK